MCEPVVPPGAAGLMVTERNWLLVFTYTSWGGNANLPHFVEGMQFEPCEVRPPPHTVLGLCAYAVAL